MASIPPAAVVAVRAFFPASARATALALAGSETGWRLEPSTVDVRADVPYTCPAYSPTPAPFSFGGWQVSLEAYASIIPGRDMCQRASYLLASWQNSAKVAAAVWRGRGDFSAWSTWWVDAAERVGPGQGPYLAYLPAAEQALGQAVSPVPATAPAAAPNSSGSGLGFPIAVAIAAVLALEVL